VFVALNDQSTGLSFAYLDFGSVSPDGIIDVNAPMTAAVQVPTGVNRTFTVTASLVLGTSANINLAADITSISGPFAAQGGVGTTSILSVSSDRDR
jgi:hypothetical protein